MRYKSCFFPVVLSLIIGVAHAQLRGRSSGFTNGNVHVHIVFDNDRAAGANLLLQLMEGSSSIPIARTFTNSEGQAEFGGIPVGDYHIVVSGEGIQTTDSGSFEVDERKVTQAQYIAVHRVEDSGPKPLDAKSPMVSAADLNVPPKARKELDKANEAMVLQDWKKAMQHITKAIDLDPQYATAYNNLGVLYSRMEDPANEQKALEKAISLDDHFSAPLVNLAKLRMRQRDFPYAETLLGKAVSLDPNNTEGLLLLADAQYMDHRWEAAIASARQAHAASAEHSAFVHYIAARAFQQEHQEQDAIAEFQRFLVEEPKGPRADHVRGDIAKMEHPAQ